MRSMLFEIKERSKNYCSNSFQLFSSCVTFSIIIKTVKLFVSQQQGLAYKTIGKATCLTCQLLIINNILLTMYYKWTIKNRNETDRITELIIVSLSFGLFKF